MTVVVPDDFPILITVPLVFPILIVVADWFPSARVPALSTDPAVIVGHVKLFGIDTRPFIVVELVPLVLFIVTVRATVPPAPIFTLPVKFVALARLKEPDVRVPPIMSSVFVGLDSIEFVSIPPENVSVAVAVSATVFRK